MSLFKVTEDLSASSHDYATQANDREGLPCEPEDNGLPFQMMPFGALKVVTCG